MSTVFDTYEFREYILLHRKDILDCVGGYMKFNRDLMNIMDSITFIYIYQQDEKKHKSKNNKNFYQN